jgi:sugar diacid utilization regulator
MRLLEEAGFLEVDLAWKRRDYFVCGGRKPSEEEASAAAAARDSRAREKALASLSPSEQAFVLSQPQQAARGETT